MTGRQITFWSLGLLLFLAILSRASAFRQQVTSHELKVGARNSTVRNIGSFRADSALIFPKREAKDTTNSKALRKKGAFFLDSTTFVTWFFDGNHFRRADSSIYNSDGKILHKRIVDIDGKNKANLQFKNGSVHIDTLLLPDLPKDKNDDSVLTIYKDTIRKRRIADIKGIASIYNANDSIKTDRTVTLSEKDKPGKKLHFTKGSVHIDTLLLKKSKIAGKSRDSFLVRYKDTIKYIPFDSVRTIYNVDDSIKKDRTITIADKESKSKKLHFTKGAVHIDTLLLKKSKIAGKSRDSFLVRYKDTIKYIPFDSVRTIYNVDDSIKKDRTITIADKENKSHKLHFTKGAVHIDTLLVKNPKTGSSFDSLLVVRNDSVYRISRDSLFNIYNKSDSIKENRIVTLRGRNNKQANVYFKGGQFLLDTLLIRQKNKGTSRDSFLVRFKDTIKYIPFDSIRTIYNVDDSIKKDRTITISDKENKSKKLHFTKGSVHIDTLLLKKSKIAGKSRDSFLVRYKDTIKYIPFDSVRTIYNVDDSIKKDRTITIADKENKSHKLKFTKGSVHIDTLLLRKSKSIGKSRDSFLVRYKDTIKYIPFDSVRTIYNVDDSIKKDRTVTIADKNKSKKLIFTKGSVHIDTLLLPKLAKTESDDSVLTIKNDTIRKRKLSNLVAANTKGNTIYSADDSIKTHRKVTLADKNNQKGKRLHFTEGSVHIDTLLLKKSKIKGTSTDSLIVRFKDTIKYIPYDSLRSIYFKDDSIRKGDRTVSMNGHNLILKNNSPNGMLLLRNNGYDNLLKIEAGNTNCRQGGIWLTEKENQYGFKLVNNAHTDRLELYVTDNSNGQNNANSTQAQSDNCGNGNNGATGWSANNSNKSTQVLSVHRNGNLQICGNGNGTNTVSSDNAPTLRFQRANGQKYWFIRFDDSRDRLYFGKQEDNFTVDGRQQQYRNRMTITDEVVIIGPKKNNERYKADVDLDVTGPFKGWHKVLDASGLKYENNTDTRNKKVPSLFVNGAAQAQEFITGSDSSLKRDIRGITGALPKILQLRPVSYYWKDTSEGSGFGRSLQTGFVAQELRHIFPNLVHTIWAEKPGTLGINYIGIIPSVVAAVQELYHQQQAKATEQNKLKQALAEEKQARQNLEQRVQVLEKLLLKQIPQTHSQNSTLE